jgi:16S rRNA (guanine966-N2)-methyltransferase
VSPLRIIGGTAKGLTLKTVKLPALRPTTDRVRSAVFSMLESRHAIIGARVLDLYAGTGSLGIEALSRGAIKADFVENNKQLATLISENLSRTKLDDKSKVHNMSVDKALGLLKNKYDLIFADPPYKMINETSESIQKIIELRLLSDRGKIILEHSIRSSFDFKTSDLAIIQTKKYGDTNIDIYELAKVSEEND